MSQQGRDMLQALRAFERGKRVSAADAVRLIRSGDTVATGGFVGIGFAEGLAIALERRFLDSQASGAPEPSDLTLVYAAGQGDGGERGLNHLAHPGLIRRVIGGHWGLVPRLQKLAVENRIEAYNFPQGVICQLFRDIAGGKPGHLTRVGLDTFVDPRHEGGKLNPRTTEQLVRLLEIDGESYLFYRAFPIDVALIRATTADPDGNLTMEREALTLEAQALAMAAHNSGGLVIAQVERLAERGSLKPREVKVPGVLVDCVVLAEDESHHWQTFATRYRAGYAGELREPQEGLASLPLSPRKVIARRAALALRANSVVNLGIGMPEGVAQVAAEENIIDLLTLTAEPGVIGGIPASGLDFGAAINPQAVIDQPSQFDFYDGGGLDIACLGLAQADREGNLNVSRFGNRLAGAGGFINISQSARQLYFLGSFRAGKGEMTVGDGRLSINREAEGCKFVEQVEQRSFSAREALRRGTRVHYITERCVFQLTEDGLLLSEVAPGIDIERDILRNMAFHPLIPRDPISMDPALFRTDSLGLRERLLAMPLAARFAFDAARGILFINFERLAVRTPDDVEAIRACVHAALAGVTDKVLALVNYDHFQLAPEIELVYAEMVHDLVDQHYRDVCRYTTSGFQRSKLGHALDQRGVAPHIYESAHEALAHLGETAG